MMYPEFELKMRVLVEEYTVEGRDPPYGKARIKAIWESFRGVSPVLFQRILDRAFTQCRQAPLARELLKIAEELRVEDHNKLKETQKLLPPEKESGLPIEESVRRVSSIIEEIKKRQPKLEDEGGDNEHTETDLREVP